MASTSPVTKVRISSSGGSGPSRSSCFAAAKVGASMQFSNQCRNSLPQIVPGDEQKSAHEPQMLEERVLDHEPIGLRNLPEAIGDKRGDERESREPEGADPAIDTTQHQRGAGKLGDDRRAGDHGRKRQTEMLRFGYCATEVEQLGEAALQVCGAKGKQGDEAKRGWRRQRVNRLCGAIGKAGPLRRGRSRL